MSPKGSCQDAVHFQTKCWLIIIGGLSECDFSLCFSLHPTHREPAAVRSQLEKRTRVRVPGENN